MSAITGERYDRIVEAFGLTEGHQHYFKECGLCGHMEWVSSINSERQILVTERSPIDSPCPRCVQVHQRAPEIVEWVTRVIQKQMRSKP